jgi:hypothetical protein
MFETMQSDRHAADAQPVAFAQLVKLHGCGSNRKDDGANHQRTRNQVDVEHPWPSVIVS